MVDVVVIGAGAAGIGAGRGLAQLRIPHVIIESKQRVGGRAFSDTSSLGALWDHGCHWLHSADINVLRQMADRLGHAYRADRGRAHHNTFTGGQWHREPIETAAVWSLLDHLAEAGRQGADVAMASLLPADTPRHVLIRHWLELMFSQPAEQISSRDAGNYRDTGLNYGVRDGYGTLVARLADGLPVRLGVSASHVSVGPAGVAVETSAGTVEAKACIVAVPARALETGKLVFSPALPDAIAEAAAEIPMGYYEKIAIGFRRPFFAEQGISHADVCDVAHSDMPINFELNPHGRPIAVGHVAGPSARALAELGEAAMIAFARDALKSAFGADVEAGITTAAVTSWTADPWINGAYSCAKPGKAHLRGRFGAAVHERVFLAGEHVHTHFMATAHGAYETGLAAAIRAAKAAGHVNPVIDPLWLPA